MNKTYVIYNMSDVSSINFSEILQDSENSLRVSLDGQKTMLKFQGETPSFLTGVRQYNYTEIIAELAKSTWTPAEQ